MQSVFMGCVDSLDNSFVFHSALKYLKSDALTAAFDPEFYDFAVGIRQAAGSFFIKKSDMGIDHEGQGADFWVGFAKLLDIGTIKGEKIVVEDKHENIPVVVLQVFDFSHQLFHREVPDIVQALEAAVQILAILGNQLVIKAVGAGKGTAAGCHQPHPAVFGIDDVLKIKYLVVFKG